MRRLFPITILCFAVLALSACSGGGDDEAGGGAAVSGEARSSISGGGVDAGGATTVGSATRKELASVGGSSKIAPDGLPQIGPRVIQTASLRLSVARGSFDDAVDEARTIATGLGGFVVSSTDSVRGGKNRPVRGTLVLRVPERGYARAVRALSDLGRVERREESGQDVSQEFVDLEARRRHLQAVETQLLELLERAKSVPAALAVQAELNNTQLQLEEVRGRLRYLEDQTELATISLSIHERIPAAGKGKGDDGIVETWKDGARAFASVTGKTFVVLATVAPVLLLILLVYAAGRFLVRRRLVPGWRDVERSS